MKTQILFTRIVKNSLIAGTLITVLSNLGCAKYSFSPVNIESTKTSTEIIPDDSLISKSFIVPPGNKQVDFILVLDDSNSMAPELAKLSQRLETFLKSIEEQNIDWQMCLITTRGPLFGIPKSWILSPHSSTTVLRYGVTNLNTIVQQTILSLPIGGDVSGDERGIKASLDSLTNAPECYRELSAKSFILISDEDERSVGGDPSKVKAKDSPTAYQALEESDKPEFLISTMIQKFGKDLRLTFNSIIVKPGDIQCEQIQDQDTSPSHPGYLYMQLSELSGGGTGSICQNDYSQTLDNFKSKILNSINKLDIACDKSEIYDFRILLDGKKTERFEIKDKTVYFQTPLQEGMRVEYSYQCLGNNFN